MSTDLKWVEGSLTDVFFCLFNISQLDDIKNIIITLSRF